MSTRQRKTWSKLILLVVLCRQYPGLASLHRWSLRSGVLSIAPMPCAEAGSGKFHSLSRSRRRFELTAHDEQMA